MFHTWPVKMSTIEPNSTPNCRVGNSATMASMTLREKAQYRDGLQDIQHGDHHHLHATVVSGDVTVGDRKYQAQHVRDGHAAPASRRRKRAAAAATARCGRPESPTPIQYFTVGEHRIDCRQDRPRRPAGPPGRTQRGVPHQRPAHRLRKGHSSGLPTLIAARAWRFFGNERSAARRIAVFEQLGRSGPS